VVGGVLLFPGAGSSSDHPSLRAVESALSPIPVMRIDFPYRRSGRKLPDRAPVLVQAVHEAVHEACDRWSCQPHNLVIGGRSMGGRMCSLAVAGFDGSNRTDQPVAPPLVVAGLVCVAYPLHPPKQPEKLRIAHLPEVRVPSLFVSGSRDEFATPEELAAHLAAVPVAPTLRMIEGARHDLRGKDAEVATIVAGWVHGLESNLRI